MDSNQLQDIFQYEQNVFDKYRDRLWEEAESNPLWQDYKELLTHYEKLLKLSNKIFKISDMQGKVLHKRENDIKNILDHSNQGFLTFGADLCIDKEYSQECLTIFGERIANLNIAELLWVDEDQRRVNKERLEMVFSTSDQLRKNELLAQLSEILMVNGRSIRARFKIIQSFEKDVETQIVMAILTDVTERVASEARVSFLSYHDSLTCLYNRAYVQKVIPEVMCPENFPISLIVGDMNGLKLVNDVFGHEQGDQLIVNTAKVLQSSCRAQDILVRWGGDEFVLILPKTDVNTCQEIMNSIKQKCTTCETDPIEVSVTMGSSTMNSTTSSFSDLFREAESIMYSLKIIEGKEHRQRVIANFLEVAEKRCFDIPGHIDRLKGMVYNFAPILGIDVSSKMMRNLLLLAEIHDIGKIMIPQDILGRKGKITEEEFEIVKAHSEAGFRLAQSIGEMEVAEAILGMHECWDGTGYPQGLKEQEIPYMARIMFILDTYDVLTHDRVYRARMGKKEVIQEMSELKGINFDPDLVDLFFKHIDQVVVEQL
ncbi:MAG TPA: diguanylate cyclase [Bacillota bacterium]|nr:diguanylate cyclase [Bacillota bacterium]